MKRKIPSFIQMYESFIKIPTISSEKKTIDQSNKVLIDLLANYFSELNFLIQIINIPNTNKFNMLSSLGIGNGGLLFSGHTDTVDFDENAWTKDPFKLTKKDDKLYGLGVVDMKGFFAFLLDVISSINIKKLKKPIYILATANEETDMSGARYFSQSTNIKPDCIIIGEPTSLKLIKAHKGHISYKIDIIGNTGHSSNPSNGINSIEIAYEVIKNLIDLKKYLQQNYSHQDFSISYPTMNLGSINGGNAINRICSLCSITFEIRPIPKLNLKTLEILLKEKLKKINKKWPNRIFLKNLFFSVPAYEISKKHKIVQKIENFCKIESTTANYCTEAPFLNKIAPTLILGPGSIDQAHYPDEYLHCSFIEPTKNILKQLIIKFCC
ncbi:acetylornithine deacetylase [Buchnera aphidicola (Aphis helianthi)]|uniref:Acetylornithine deacetylase n=1 Tax=Buchnera aphidicola (Aphis helianthi) TaxID=2315802 RepID=A0A4D6XMT8_9GAMM|nr:acetylornithine deacetylase [Buchnera aphidicola]QCI16889.1 acetylornithine deacetylase [Buchnera aphidicola (Aphis helianthi)]